VVVPVEAAGALVAVALASPIAEAAERAQRAGRIGTTVGRVYLGLKANQVLARGLSRDQMRPRWQRYHADSATAVYDAAIELRGPILKSCQYLGARADLLPREWTDVLSRLQDRVPPRDLPTVRRVVETEIGRPLERVFARFAAEPVASASLAQVHEAWLHDGRRVAVKVQYPEIAALVRSDLANLRTLFRTIDWLEGQFDLLAIVEEMGRTVPRELDFLAEARASSRMAALFAARDDVHVPRVHHELTTRRVLVMDFVDGIKITDRAALDAASVDLDRIVRTLIEAWCEQVLVHGFFQADPHPGNLMVERGSGRLVLLDFGLSKSLPPEFRGRALALLLALLRRDPEEMADALLALGFSTRDGNRQGLVSISRIGLLLATELATNGSLSPERLEAIGAEIAAEIRGQSAVRIPSHVVLLARTLGLLSGLAHQLATGVDPLQIVFPYVMGAAPLGPSA
jgi:predicted unusual protein kinase regulating ubiquinone biosynthesis (AarF/ABC1/UbiB family)